MIMVFMVNSFNDIMVIVMIILKIVIMMAMMTIFMIWASTSTQVSTLAGLEPPSSVERYLVDRHYV